MADFTPEKCKQIALARLDVVHQWLEFRKKSQNKLQADYDFVKLHNTSNSHLFEILGKISRGSLHRWYAMLNGCIFQSILGLAVSLRLLAERCRKLGFFLSEVC